MANNPWRSSNRFFSCKPDCSERKPGCQDHCEKHAQEKARWEEIKAAKKKYESATVYTAESVARNMDISAKKRRDWKRYHRSSGS